MERGGGGGGQDNPLWIRHCLCTFLVVPTVVDWLHSLKHCHSFKKKILIMLIHMKFAIIMNFFH